MTGRDELRAQRDELESDLVRLLGEIDSVNAELGEPEETEEIDVSTALHIIAGTLMEAGEYLADLAKRLEWEGKK